MPPKTKKKKKNTVEVRIKSPSNKGSKVFKTACDELKGSAKGSKPVPNDHKVSTSVPNNPKGSAKGSKPAPTPCTVKKVRESERVKLKHKAVLVSNAEGAAIITRLRTRMQTIPEGDAPVIRADTSAAKALKSTPKEREKVEDKPTTRAKASKETPKSIAKENADAKPAKKAKAKENSDAKKAKAKENADTTKVKAKENADAKPATKAKAKEKDNLYATTTNTDKVYATRTTTRESEVKGKDGNVKLSTKPQAAKEKKKPVAAVAAGLAPSVRIAKVFHLGPKLGAGAFGDVFSGHDIRTGAEVAVKMEPLHAECPQLLYESRVMQELQAAPGFPRHHWFGVERDYNVLVMQRLGRCLASRYMPVEVDVVQSVARDALARLQTLHAAGFAHRDIKPENFVYGVGAAKSVLYIIDFGLCKRVVEPRTGRHIPHRWGKSLSGTPRYASTRMHDGEEQARRDDIEALGYMLVYLAKGSLPWQGLPTKDDYREAGNLKKTMKVGALCEGLPPAFAATIAYARGLDFTAMPDYIYLRALWA